MGTLNEPATTVHADAQVFDSEHLPDTVTGRADKSLPQLTRDERRAVVGEMREAGMSTPP